MKALTICQPYAHLICFPETDPRHKRVENRRWPTNYRGPLAIHAGKSRAWLDIGESETGEGRHDNYDIPISVMVFGAVVAIVHLVDCVHIERLDREHPKCVRDTYPWLADHLHTEGPWCWITSDVKRRAKMVPWRGAQGLFEIPDEVLR